MSYDGDGALEPTRAMDGSATVHRVLAPANQLALSGMPLKRTLGVFLPATLTLGTAAATIASPARHWFLGFEARDLTTCLFLHILR